MLPIFIAFSFIILAGLSHADAQISIIVAKSSGNTATEAQIKEFFAGTQLNWPGGDKVQIATQEKTPTGKSFYKEYVGVSVSQARKQWTKLSLSGQALALIKCGDDAEVLKAVAEGDNVIGFISSSALNDSVKEIVRIN